MKKTLHERKNAYNSTERAKIYQQEKEDSKNFNSYFGILENFPRSMKGTLMVWYGPPSATKVTFDFCLTRAELSPPRPSWQGLIHGVNAESRAGRIVRSQTRSADICHLLPATAVSNVGAFRLLGGLVSHPFLTLGRWTSQHETQ